MKDRDDFQGWEDYSSIHGRLDNSEIYKSHDRMRQSKLSFHIEMKSVETINYRYQKLLSSAEDVMKMIMSGEYLYNISLSLKVPRTFIKNIALIMSEVKGNNLACLCGDTLFHGGKHRLFGKPREHKRTGKYLVDCMNAFKLSISQNG